MFILLKKKRLTVIRAVKMIQFAGVAVLLTACNGEVAEEGVSRGEELFSLCANCHGVDGTGSEEQKAPQIAGMDAAFVESQLTAFFIGERGLDAGDISGMRMRPMALTLNHGGVVSRDSEEWQGENNPPNEATLLNMRAVAEYIATLSPVASEPTLGGDSARGELIYSMTAQVEARQAWDAEHALPEPVEGEAAVEEEGEEAVVVEAAPTWTPPSLAPACDTCHGVDGSGVTGLGSALVGLQDWYIAAQIANFKGWRGQTATGVLMTTVAPHLSDQDVADVSAYISTLSVQE
jgi:cytochrome c553